MEHKACLCNSHMTEKVDVNDIQQKARRHPLHRPCRSDPSVVHESVDIAATTRYNLHKSSFMDKIIHSSGIFDLDSMCHAVLICDV